MRDCQGDRSRTTILRQILNLEGEARFQLGKSWMELDIEESSSGFCKPSVVESSKLVVYGSNPGERIYGVCAEVLSEAAD